MTLDLNLLKALDAFMIERSVGRAAERLGLSQPATSHTLNRLRDALNDPILVRSGARMVPTPFAGTVAPEVRTILKRIEETLSIREAFDPTGLEETFRISTADDFQAAVGPALFQALRGEAPKSRLQFVPIDPVAAFRDMERGHAHLMINVAWTSQEALTQVGLHDERFVAVARAGPPSSRTAARRRSTPFSPGITCSYRP